MKYSQLCSRQSIVALLVKAGWDLRGWELLFDADHELSPELHGEYRNALFELRLSYFVTDEYLLLEILPRLGDGSLILRLYPADSVEAVIKTVITAQKTLKDQDYDTLLNDLKLVSRVIVSESSNQVVEIGRSGSDAH